jgi:predicted amidohydrolase
MVGQIFADQIEVTIRHHALEAGCFVVNATGWLSPEQAAQITPDEQLQRVLSGGIYKAVTTTNTWGCDRFLASVFSLGITPKCTIFSALALDALLRGADLQSSSCLDGS